MCYNDFDNRLQQDLITAILDLVNTSTGVLAVASTFILYGNTKGLKMIKIKKENINQIIKIMKSIKKQGNDMVIYAKINNNVLQDNWDEIGFTTIKEVSNDNIK